MNFDELVNAIRDADQHLAASAKKAVNVSLTVRNWLIGHYVSEYELNGADRADYGKRVVAELAQKLKDISNCDKGQLHRYVRFYRTYPQIVRTASPQFSHLLLTTDQNQIVGTASPQSQEILAGQLPTVVSSPLATQIFPAENEAKILGTLSPKFSERLLESFSYSHFEKLSEIDDETKRLFYEVECVRGGWTVRELRRQIGSLCYERSGLSFDKKKLAELTQKDAEQMSDKLAIRDPYVFEFLGLTPKEVMSESHLEDQLMDKLEDFILELGNGFCFEARQKRILIGGEHYFVDIVFYHRILKCHVLIEVKVEEFSHESMGQLNTYVSWYRKNVMTDSDNPPIGILLCTGKNEALVEYALAGMDNNLFVSKYLLELPKKEEMRAFIEKQMKELAVENKEG